MAFIITKAPEKQYYFKAGHKFTFRYKLLLRKYFAHGFITLTDDTEATYLVSEFYTPNSEGGLRWDDPNLGIDWKMTDPQISKRDGEWPAFSDFESPFE